MQRGSGVVAAATGVAAVVGALGWGEWLNWRWSRRLVGDGGSGSEAVVVLGYRNPQATANLINRWRVRAGIRSITPTAASTPTSTPTLTAAVTHAQDTRLIFSGGTTGTGRAGGGTGITEAQVMADYATSVLGFDGTVLLEERSTTTWENITNVIPFLEGVDRIKIASQPAHALKARAYLRRQRPDLAERLVRAADYRPGEWVFVKPVLALYGLWTLRGLTADERTRNASA
ncbi:YdcF family protein [Streptomyces venezuelae]|uniref:YdcF family protein n=1 Tax=Streptomyces venezuelae TaxID=54571 RepID=UPI0037B3E910